MYYVYDKDCVNEDWSQKISLFPFKWYEMLLLDILLIFSILGGVWCL